MSTNMYLSALTGNLMSYGFQILLGTEPFDITDFNVKFYLKADSGALDSSGTSYGVGTGITVLNASQGVIQVDIPAEDFGDAEDVMWWHLDVVDPMDDTNVQTALDGIFGVNTN